ERFNPHDRADKSLTWAFVTAAKNLWHSMAAVASVCASNRLMHLQDPQFSNNPSSTFGPPSFASAAFAYKGGALQLPMQLSYEPRSHPGSRMASLPEDGAARAPHDPRWASSASDPALAPPPLRRWAFLETPGKIAKTGPLTAPADDCSDSPPDVKFRSVC